MKTSVFDYDLPKRFIAQEPASSRDHSKMMVFDRSTDRIQHKHFYDLLDLLDENDVLIVNKSKVIPARIIFEIDEKEREIFILRNLGDNKFKVLVRPGRFFKIGRKFHLDDVVFGEVEKVFDDGARIIQFNDKIDRFGEVPLPPYITNHDVEFSKYQTVYADPEGSVAAPTAGLHFTGELIQSLIKKGVCIEEVVLHVGRGTFLPVSTDDIRDHVMHSEYFELTDDTARRLDSHRKNGKRLIAVGTTSVRVLESSFVEGKGFIPNSKETDIFIYPGYKWKAVDALITNFHLPKSTLLMLVASFLNDNDVEKTKELYELAKEQNYRFYSFGDCMFLL